MSAAMQRTIRVHTILGTDTTDYPSPHYPRAHYPNQHSLIFCKLIVKLYKLSLNYMLLVIKSIFTNKLKLSSKAAFEFF